MRQPAIVSLGFKPMFSQFMLEDAYRCRIFYGYADDHKIAFRIQVGDLENEATVIKQLDECLLDIMHWMNQKKLKMNNSKTEIILYGTKQQLSKVNISSVNVGGIEVKCVDHVRDLGVLMENNLSFDRHIRKNVKLRIFS